MPHIQLPDLPGIRGPMAFRPETATPLNGLVDVLLRGPSTLTPGERELIATFVSARNDCRYCQTIHGAIAAHHLYEGDLIVIDFGTATTFDVIDYQGTYKGGIIAPGINLSLDALVAAAAKLPKIAIAPPENRSVIGRTTEAQMHIGVFWGYVAMMEGLVARTRAEIGRPAKVISTGGLAVLFDENSEIFDAIAPDLTILGLALLHERSLKN